MVAGVLSTLVRSSTNTRGTAVLLSQRCGFIKNALREFDGADIITRVVREGRSHQKGGVVAVEVSTNGADFTSSGKTYAYVALPTVSSIRPPRGPMKGRTEVLVMGTGFLRSSAH